MFLRSNARAAGLVDGGQPLQATYVAAIEDGRMVGGVATCWNGMILVQAPAHAAALAAEAVRRSRRAATGFSGPWAQVVAARDALGLATAAAVKDSRDQLYALELDRLVVPKPLASGAVRCRHPRPEDLELLVEWRTSFSVEALGAADGPGLHRASRADVLLHHERGADWVLVDDKTPVAYSVFNAMLPDMVQIGGVWTPPEFRGRGYARSVVAGSLVAAGKQGVGRGGACAGSSNAAGTGGDLGDGVESGGDYGLVLLAP